MGYGNRSAFRNTCTRCKATYASRKTDINQPICIPCLVDDGKYREAVLRLITIQRDESLSRMGDTSFDQERVTEETLALDKIIEYIGQALPKKIRVVKSGG